MKHWQPSQQPHKAFLALRSDLHLSFFNIKPLHDSISCDSQEPSTQLSGILGALATILSVAFENDVYYPENKQEIKQQRPSGYLR
jgi:hypothetical protein